MYYDLIRKELQQSYDCNPGKCHKLILCCSLGDLLNKVCHACFTQQAGCPRELVLRLEIDCRDVSFYYPLGYLAFLIDTWHAN